MTPIANKFLDLFFNEDETVCVSPNKYGYHSVSQDSLETIQLVSPSDKVEDTQVSINKINLMALNPISGFRSDKNVTAYRSFLIELDEGSLDSQSKYVESMGMPYSVCVFSGNKSLHYGVVLDKDLVNDQYWRLINQWILNIMSKADQQTKNPSRSIRFPDNMRSDGKKLKQSLVEIKNRITRDELNNWLNRFPEHKPKPKIHEKREASPVVSNSDIPDWLFYKLKDGIVVERNATWFKYACAMSNVGFDFDQTIDIFENFFTEENDFSRTEWISAIKSAYKTTGGI